MLVSGHLTRKSGYWYMVLNLRMEDGRKQPKWFSTGLKEKNNKRKAEELLIEMRQKYSAYEMSEIGSHKILFSDYMKIWLSSMKTQIALSTYESYHQIIHQKVAPYFCELEIPLISLKPLHIEEFYQKQYELKLSSNTVLRYHAVIHKALADATRKELISQNPASLVKRPSKTKYVAIPYSTSELKQLFVSIKGHNLELIIKLAAFYGLRRK